MQELMHIIELMQNRRFIDEIFGLQSIDSFIHFRAFECPMLKSESYLTNSYIMNWL